MWHITRSVNTCSVNSYSLNTHKPGYGESVPAAAEGLSHQTGRRNHPSSAYNTLYFVFLEGRGRGARVVGLEFSICHVYRYRMRQTPIPARQTPAAEEHLEEREFGYIRHPHRYLQCCSIVRCVSPPEQRLQALALGLKHSSPGDGVTLCHSWYTNRSTTGWTSCVLIHNFRWRSTSLEVTETRRIHGACTTWTQRADSTSTSRPSCPLETFCKIMTTIRCFLCTASAAESDMIPSATASPSAGLGRFGMGGLYS